MSQKNNTPSIAELLAGDPSRMKAMCSTSHFWRLDAGLTPIDRDRWSSIDADCAGATERLFSGEIVNPSEDRPALHPALRASDASAPPHIVDARDRMLALAEAFFHGRTPVQTLLHVGIGGSDLGPRLVTEALDPQDSAVDVHWLATLDDRKLRRLLADLDPSTTGLVVASKSFGTRESLLQAAAIRDWLGDGAEPRIWAATANVERATAWGVPASNVLPVDEAIGGRFSLWSAVGVSAAARIGRPRFEALLRGAARADTSVRQDPDRSLAGRLTTVIDALVRDHGFVTLGVVAYAPQLRRLADYLQQLVMESLGKAVTPDSEPSYGPSAPLIFGGAGTDLQHAAFQALHQGSFRHPMLLVGEVPGEDDVHDFQAEQLSNLLGQARTLALGRDDADPAKRLPGGNPVLTLVTRRLDAEAVGELLAHWEHAVYLLGHRWNLNPFDQWGVEEGKRQAAALLEPLRTGRPVNDPAVADLMAWIAKGESDH